MVKDNTAVNPDQMILNKELFVPISVLNDLLSVEWYGERWDCSEKRERASCNWCGKFHNEGHALNCPFGIIHKMLKDNTVVRGVGNA